MFCWQCGKVINQGEFFCANCGAKVVQSQEQESTLKMVPSGPATQPMEVQEPMLQAAAVPEVQSQEIQDPGQQEPPAPQPMEVQEPVIQEPATQPIEAQEPVMQEPSAPQPTEMQKPIVQEPAGPVIQGPMQQVPVEQKPVPKPLNKGVLVTVMIAAVLVFLIGVVGAFYFAEGGDSSDDGMTQGRWEEMEDKDDTVKQEVPSESEDPNFDNPGENLVEEKLPTQEEKPTEGEKTIPEEPDKDETHQDIPDSESNWDNQRIPAFSGRDVYPDIDGYAEGQLGDSMHTYWFDYSVTGAYICTEYGGYLPQAGHEVLVVEMAVRNTFDEKIPMYDIDFQAQWNEVSDSAYAWPLEDAEFLGENVLPSYYVLEEGQMVIGLLLFEVPVGYSDFTIAYWEMFDDDTYGDLFFLDFTVDRNQSEITI